MPLTPNAKLGSYAIVAPLGAGGMGEVYRAKDSRLDRDVAIKVLPEAFARDPERMARFQREAKVLASLNHPNIAAIYGFEEFEGKRFLVMELAEGETLAERLDRGPIPMRDALEMANGIAIALEAAHEKGIIHRDLKPANVKVTPDGTVKVLDFGLAKAMTGDATGTDIANSPTITVEHTRPGVVLGTAAYMSPEQARGKPLDKRTDVWSFGALLYECLTGRRPFRGETTSDLVAKILEREPDWSLLPPGTPPLVQLLLRRCLAKDRNKRLRDIGDARVEIESALHDPTTSGALFAGMALADEKKGSRRGISRVAGILAVVLLVGAGFGWGARWWSEPMPAPRVTRFNLDVPAPYGIRIGDESNGSSFSLNRSGTMLAFTAHAEGVSRVFVRDFSASDARPLPGTEEGSNPFFSPDGRWVGFFKGGQLLKAPVGGGPAITVCGATGNDAVWLEDGTIILDTAGGRSLVRVGESGGSATELASAGPTRRSADGKQLLLGFQTLHALRGADYVLAGVWDGTTIEDYAIVSVSLVDGTVRPVMLDGVAPSYVAPGFLVFLRGSSILAAPFDAKHGVVTGEPVQVIESVVVSKWADSALFATCESGSAAYVSGNRPGPGRRLIRVDASGKSEPLMDGTDAIVGGMRVSPDGREVLVTTMRRNIDLWSFNLARRSLSLVNNLGESWNPVWTPDSQSVVYWQVIPEKSRNVVRKRIDGSGAAEPVAVEGSTDQVYPNSFSPDGTQLLLTLVDVSPERRNDIALYRLGQPGPLELVLGSGANESSAAFAPEGRYFAYTSNETGRYEVFVRTLSDTGSKWQISQAGGHEPVWSRDGKKLFFLDHKDIMYSVSVDLEVGPQFSAPEKLFDTTGIATTDLWGIYDVLPDGGFAMTQPAGWEMETPHVHVVLNWQEDLKKR
ncbi:MAG: protein kinase [Phycisphaerales bacterium]|nr:protein kinase [Phycisphaerales bacterium]